MAQCLLAAADAPPRLEITETQHQEFPAGGELDVKHLAGELTIEGWDRPELEITTVKYTPEEYTGKDREKASKLLQETHVTAARNGDRVVVETSGPKHSRFLLLTFGIRVDVDYRIKVPRSARLVVNHRSGEVHIIDVDGDIRASARDGLITLMLPPKGQYAIDASSTVGDVYSDFPGAKHDKSWRFSHSFTDSNQSAAHKLYLRIKFGDIMIGKDQ